MRGSHLQEHRIFKINRGLRLPNKLTLWRVNTLHRKDVELKNKKKSSVTVRDLPLPAITSMWGYDDLRRFNISSWKMLLP